MTLEQSYNKDAKTNLFHGHFRQTILNVEVCVCTAKPDSNLRADFGHGQYEFTLAIKAYPEEGDSCLLYLRFDGVLGRGLIYIK